MSVKIVPSLKKQLHLLSFLLVLIPLTSFVFFYLFSDTREKLAEQSAQKDAALELIDRLQNSSNDLTRLARSYVATGQIQYKRHYHNILEVRAGNAPRPQNYRSTYWQISSNVTGQLTAVPLIELIADLDFDQTENNLFHQALSQSNKLAELELLAFNKFEEQDNSAISLLFSDSYYKTKLTIIKPLEELNNKVSERYQQSITTLRNQENTYFNFLLVSLIMASLLAILIIFRGKKLILAPIDQLIGYCLNIKEGKPSTSLNISSSLEFKILAHEMENMYLIMQRTMHDLDDHLTFINDANNKVRAIFDEAPDAIVTVDETGYILDINNKVEKMLGYKRSELLGNAVEVLLPRDKRFLHHDFVSSFFRSPSHRPMTNATDLKARHKDGSHIDVAISLSMTKQGDHSVAIATIRDVTEQRRNRKLLAQAKEEAENALNTLKATQESLIEAEKMSSLGSLVAGVAHEINTPIGVGLTGITHLSENTKELIRKHEEKEMKRSDLENYLKSAGDATTIIESNLRRASDLIKSFKQVAVDSSSDNLRTINLFDYMHDVVNSLHPKLKKTNHTVHITGDKELLIECNPGAISQIITNLVMNALIHAFEDDQEGNINIEVSKDNKNTFIAFSDDGKGMTEDVKKNVFAPFFTTRRNEGGSGLGMHILYNLVRQTLMGNIKVESELGKGTKYLINFPYSEVSKNGE